MVLPVRVFTKICMAAAHTSPVPPPLWRFHLKPPLLPASKDPTLAFSGCSALLAQAASLARLAALLAQESFSVDPVLKLCRSGSSFTCTLLTPVPAYVQRSAAGAVATMARRDQGPPLPQVLRPLNELCLHRSAELLERGVLTPCCAGER